MSARRKSTSAMSSDYDGDGGREGQVVMGGSPEARLANEEWAGDFAVLPISCLIRARAGAAARSLTRWLTFRVKTVLLRKMLDSLYNAAVESSASSIALASTTLPWHGPQGR